MRLLNPVNLWQADHLPHGLSIHDGIISGSVSEAGTFSVPVTVSNSLGSDTKNITIISLQRPGTQKFSILQNGSEVDRLSIPELQAMVQDGSAQSRFNCTNTQIILPVRSPALKFFYYYNDEDNPYGDSTTIDLRPSTIQNVAVNFCNFSNVTLLDGSTRPGLFLQFDKFLWNKYAPFDTGDIAPDEGEINSNVFNRWKYCTLRQWLNSEGSHWFSPAYEGDALIPYQSGHTKEELLEEPEYDCRSTYADDNSLGFLDLLPDDLHNALVPIRVVTKAFFDDNNSNTTIDDPDDLDGVDVDITFDKVFIPSMREMGLDTHDPTRYSNEEMDTFMSQGVEGNVWSYWYNKFTQVAYSGFINSSYQNAIQHNGQWLYFLPSLNQASVGYHSPFVDVTDFRNNLFRTLTEDIIDSFLPPEDIGDEYDLSSWQFKTYNYGLLRTPIADSSDGVSVFENEDQYVHDLIHNHLTNSYVFCANPAPAFVIC